MSQLIFIFKRADFQKWIADTIGDAEFIYDFEQKNPSQPLIAHTIQIVNGTANVNASAYLDYQFIIPPNASSIMYQERLQYKAVVLRAS